MSYYVNPARRVQCYVNGVDYSETFVQFSCTDASANRNGIVSTEGELIIGDDGLGNLQAGYRRNQFKRGQPVIINVQGDDGTYIRHPRGSLVVLGVNYNIQDARLKLEVGCILAYAALRDDTAAFELVHPYSPFILPPDRKTWQNVSAALQSAGRYLYQNNAGGVSVSDFFSNATSPAVSVLGVTTLSAEVLAGAAPIPDKVSISYEYPITTRETPATKDGNEGGSIVKITPCSGCPPNGEDGTGDPGRAEYPSSCKDGEYREVPVLAGEPGVPPKGKPTEYARAFVRIENGVADVKITSSGIGYRESQAMDFYIPGDSLGGNCEGIVVYPAYLTPPTGGNGDDADDLDDLGDGDLGDACFSDFDCNIDFVCLEGSCRPPEAAPDCLINTDCESGFVCTAEKCTRDPNTKCKIDYDCRFRPEGNTCVNGYCESDPGGNTCVDDSFCVDGYFCNDDFTCQAKRPECKADGNCPAGFVCIDGSCIQNPEGIPCNDDFDCGSSGDRYTCVGAVCTDTEGDECTVNRPCEPGFYCDYGKCQPEDPDPGDPGSPCFNDFDCNEGSCISGICEEEEEGEDDPLNGKPTKVETISSYTTSYPSIAFERKQSESDPSLARIKRLEQKQKELAKVTGCGNTPEEPDDLGPTSCSDDYTTSRVNVTVNVNRTSKEITQYDGPGAAISRKETYEYAPAFELNRQYYADKYAFCRATFSTGCQPNGNCQMTGQNNILASKTITTNSYNKEGTLFKRIQEDYETKLSAAIPADWRAGVVNGIPQGFQSGLSESLFLARHVTTEYNYQLNSTTVTTTTWTSKAVEASSGISVGDIDARRGIKRINIDTSYGKNLNPPIEDASQGEPDGPGEGPGDTGDPDAPKPFDPYDPSTWPTVPDRPTQPPFDPNDPSTWPPNPNIKPEDPDTWPDDPDFDPDDEDTWPPIDPDDPLDWIDPEDEDTWPRDPDVDPNDSETWPDDPDFDPQDYGTYPPDPAFDPDNKTTYPKPPFDPDNPDTWPDQDPNFDINDPTTWPANSGYDPQQEVQLVTTFFTGTSVHAVSAGGGSVGGEVTVEESLPVPLYQIDREGRAAAATRYGQYIANFEKGEALGVQITEYLREEFMENYKPGVKFYYYDPKASSLLQLRMDGTTWLVSPTECTFTTDGIYHGTSNGTVSIPNNTELS